jgi:hypothetical protein
VPTHKKKHFQKSGRAGWNGIFTFHPLIGSAILPHAAVGNIMEETHKYDVQAEDKLRYFLYFHEMTQQCWQ